MKYLLRVLNLSEMNVSNISNLKKNFPLLNMFLSRKKAKKDLLNEDKLLEKLSKFGFERVYFEDLSFEHQIYLSLNTKILVGYHGNIY